MAHASTICSLDGIAVGVYDTSKVNRYHRDGETAQPPPGQEGSGPHAGHDQRHHPQVWPSRTTTSSRLGRPCEHQPFDAPVRGAAAPAARAGELLGRRIGKHSEAAVRRFDDKFATRAIVRALACRCLSWKCEVSVVRARELCGHQRSGFMLRRWTSSRSGVHVGRLGKSPPPRGPRAHSG